MRLLHRDRHRHDDTRTTADEPVADRSDDQIDRDDRYDPDDRFDGDHDRTEHRAERPEATAAMAAAPRERALERDTSVDSTVDEVETVRPVRIRERSWAFAPGQLVSLAAGALLVAIGAVALIRAGLGEPLSRPTVEVLGWTHTAWLGLVEIGVGALLMLVGASVWGKWMSVFLGAAMVVAGVIVRAEPGGIPEELGVEQAMGWPLIALGALVALAAMILPVWRTTTTNTRIIDLTADDRHADPDARVNERLVVERRDDEDAGRHFWSRR